MRLDGLLSHSYLFIICHHNIRAILFLHYACYSSMIKYLQSNISIIQSILNAINYI